MQLILSHVNTDFDALGAMVGASKLYPQARMVLAGSQDRNVKEFLTLHEEFFDLFPARSVDREAVTRVIVVETQSSRRLGELGDLVLDPRVDVILYDHHIGGDSDIPARERHVEPLGAATTLLVREIRGREQPGDAPVGDSISQEADIPRPPLLTPLEATTMLLGIYEDTGSLTFSATTPEDLEAAAWLLRAGASLDIVSRFVNRALSPEQRHLLNGLLANTEYLEVDGVPIAIARSEAGPYVNELALLAHKLSELENVPLVFVLARMADAVYVVGRARAEVAHVGEVLAQLGGGGHSRAASAVLHGVDVEVARSRLLAALAPHVRREPVAREIMSVPARTISPDAAMAEARRRMVRYGHSGLSVVDDGRLVGVITRRDVDKARHHRLAHAPVKGFMTRQVVTAGPETPLSEMERRMIERDVGRLPVLEDGRVVGVVTRGDLLRARCGSEYAGHAVPLEADEVVRRLEERLPRRLQEVLREVAALAEQPGSGGSAAGGGLARLDLYLVGGFVRDLLLDVQNLDVDLVVVGDAIRFAAEVASRLGGKLKGHHQFSTATVLLPDGVKLDFSTARSETYGQPGALPEVEASSIEDDLKRRDFSINAIAIQVNVGRYGQLLDPCGGRLDLERGTVRVLHNLSFVEDPTRIFRAIRFEARYGFLMDEHTEALARHALRSGALEQISPERRRAEFSLLFREPNPIGGLRRIAELGILEWLSPGLELHSERLERVEGAIAWTLRHANGGAERRADLPGPGNPSPLDRTVIYLAVLLADLGPEPASAVAASKLRLSEPKLELLRLCLERLPYVVESLSRPERRPHDIFRTLDSQPLEVLALVRVWCRDPVIDERLELYLSRLRHERLEITGDDLRARGVRPGPQMGEALRQTLNARLDGELTGREAELQFALERLGAGAPRTTDE